MAMLKKATFSHKCKVAALNNPQGSGWDIYELPNQIKTASKNIESEDLGGFDLKAATKEHPDNLYIKIFAIKKDEPNDNGDAFSEEELKKAADTFVGVPLFTNHQNDDVEKARGECVHSWYDDKEGGIFIIGRVDKVAYPPLARGIEEGYITGTSMGCSVEYSICSVCHNKAHTSKDYCSHVANRKNRKYDGEIKCAYHKSPTATDEKCPVCGSTKDNIKTLKYSEQPIYEHNYGLKFIENSFVVNPACHDCGVKCVLHVPSINKKIAALKDVLDGIVKNATTQPEFFEENAENLVKLGGVKELESLKNSMSQMEVVVKSMLMQKENVSMEYVSDLVKAMSEIQNIYDELIEMGYGALPSPSAIASSVAETPVGTFPNPVPPPTPSPISQAHESQTSDMNGLGNITMPKNSSRKIEDFSTNNQKIINKISSLESNIKELINYSKYIGVKMATQDNNTKTAAGAENIEVITEKQLEKKNTDLHPRTGEVYEGITESKEQIGGKEKSNDTTSESPQVRKGTYETITEDQLKSESSLGSAIIHFGEYPDVITEKQWNDFSRDIAGKLPDDYTESITQAQIRDLLSKHKFIGDVETITEDQLKNISMTDGLKRWANKSYSVSLIKSAMDVVAEMISQYKISPDEIKKVSSLICDDDETRSRAAFLSVINSVPQKKEARKAVASRASYFNKTASSYSIQPIDALIISAANHGKLGMKVEDLFDFVNKVSNDKEAMNKVENMISSKREVEKGITKAEAFSQALKEIDKPEDGKYKIKATLKDIGVPVTNKAAFVGAVKKFAQEMIGDDSVAAAVIKIDVTPDGGLEIDVSDANIVDDANEMSADDMGDIIENEIDGEVGADLNGEEGAEGIEGTEGIEGEETPEPAEENALDGEQAGDRDDKIEDTGSCTVAKAKKEIKTAQMMGGEMGGQGGASQAPGAGATLPQAPGAGAPAAPGLENFENQDMGDEEGDMGEDKEALPPGSICPVCGSEDVDIVAGKGKCNNCNSEMTYKVEINVTKWQGVTPTEEEAAEEGFEGEGFEMPEAGAEPGAEAGAGAGAGMEGAEMPAVAAYTRLTPEALTKLAEKNIQIGTISPATGSTNTVKIGSGQYICLDSGTHYKVSFVVDAKNPKKGAYAQWEWTPRVASLDCPSCRRAKNQFVKALSSINISETDFDKMDLGSKVKTIAKLKKAGNLKTIKTASKNGSVVSDYKLAYGNWGESFPMESCVEKLARRYGENALCLSGPDEGKPLAESICNRLKKADIYTDKIAIKIAESWGDSDGDEECITHQVRSGYTLRDAASICESLKMAVAEPIELLAQALEEDFADESPEASPVGEEVAPEPEDDFDPFSGEEASLGDGTDAGAGSGAGTITLELPAEMVEELDKQLDVALGENPGEEEHHDETALDASPEGADPMAPEGDTVAEEPVASEGIAGPEESITPADLNETSECTQFKSENPEQNKGVLENTKKVTVSINGQPSGEGETKPSTAEEDQSVDEEVLAENKEFTLKEAMNMNKSIGKVGKAHMDLSGVVAVLKKQASEKQISQEKAQDSKDIGKYTAGEGGSLMGHEKETIRTPQKPSVPRDKALMGQEPDDLNPQDKPQPVIPSENATMGHEDEAGLSAGDTRYTGGDKGQGKTELASIEEELYHMKGFGRTKDSLAKLADKLAPKAPVSEDKDIQPIKGDGTIGKEEKFDAKEPTNVEGSATESLIGHEKETLKKAPKSPADHPDVNTGNAQMGKEELDSEKTTKDKGTVIASGDSESEAVRVAGRMLQNKMIEASDLYSKINELKQYKSEQIKDFEKAIFAKKGLDTVSEGMSQPIQINETSSVRNAHEDLTKKLQSMFTLGKRNELADSDDLTAIRKAYGR